MRNTGIALLTVALFLVLGAVPALAGEGATVVVYHDSDTQTFSWGNPCTATSVEITTLMEHTGRYVIDANGKYHFTHRNISVSGYDSEGWVVESVRIADHREASGWAFPDDITGFTWVIHFKVGDPNSTQFYVGHLNVNWSEGPDGELVVRSENATLSCNWGAA